MPEYNVYKDIQACIDIFNAKWEILLTPLDTCGSIILKHQDFLQIQNCPYQIPQAIMENYEVWAFKSGQLKKITELHESSVLFDTVAIYLAISQDFVKIEKISLKISSSGQMEISESGKICHCAIEWQNIPGFYHWLVQRLCIK
jgi:inosine-uridine nucleoside N-ribohydrolase